MSSATPESAPEPMPKAEPRAVTGAVEFSDADFRALVDPLSGDAHFNDARLVTRRKLAALGKRVAAGAAEAGLALDSRTSIHNPHAFNGKRVRRLWTYATRGKAEKSRLRKELGRDLAKDLDAAYRNAYLCIAVEAAALEVSLRIHADGWMDGQNLKRRVEVEGYRGLQAVLNELSGFTLRMHDWKGEWALGDLGIERVEEFFGYYTPGEHRFAVERRWPAPEGAREHCSGPGVTEELVREALRLVPLYRFAAWSEESPFLFGV
jgi:hypothetical protein